LVCNVCDASVPVGDGLETADVPSNVRRFRGESFAVWRCPACRCIHARDDVNLDHYYQDYPFQQQRLDAITRAFFCVSLKRLRRGGLRLDHSLLDYGCGSGLFLAFLRGRGFAAARGYDAFAEKFHAPALLDATYQCVFSQDVLEHAAAPRELLALFDQLAAPGGLIVIGTPNATAVDLSRSADCIHTLHQPYHRTILTKAALIACGRGLGWTVVRHYDTPYVNTRVPFLNVRTWNRYSRAHDNTLDLAFEPIRVNRALLTWGTLFDGLFGSLRCPATDVMVLFRKGIRS